MNKARLLTQLCVCARRQYPQLAGGAAPSPRNAAMMVAVGSRLVLHGGWCVRRMRAALTYLDLLCRKSWARSPARLASVAGSFVWGGVCSDCMRVCMHPHALTQQ